MDARRSIRAHLIGASPVVGGVEGDNRESLFVHRGDRRRGGAGIERALTLSGASSVRVLARSVKGLIGQGGGKDEQCCQQGQEQGLGEARTTRLVRGWVGSAIPRVATRTASR